MPQPIEHRSPLISTEALQRRLATEPMVVLDARREYEDFARERIPGARHAGLETELSRPPDNPEGAAHGGRHPLPDESRWRELLRSWGIGAPADTAIVVYDQRDSSMAAARCWWMLRASGYHRVQVLDGGLDAWRRSGAAVQSGHQTPPPPTPTSPADPWSAIGFDPAWFVDIDALTPEHSPLLLDARSGARFRGEGDPFDPATGHIPGSLNAPFAEALRNDGTFRSSTELHAWLAPLTDSTSGDDLVVSCGSGVTACHLALSLEIAGLPRPRLYVGSWSEWCRRGLPIETGPAR